MNHLLSEAYDAAVLAFGDGNVHNPKLQRAVEAVLVRLTEQGFLPAMPDDQIEQNQRMQQRLRELTRVQWKNGVHAFPQMEEKAVELARMVIALEDEVAALKQEVSNPT